MLQFKAKKKEKEYYLRDFLILKDKNKLKDDETIQYDL